MAKPRKFKKRRRLGRINIKLKKTYSDFEMMYKALSVTSVCTLMATVVYALVFRFSPQWSALIAILYGLGGVWLGYCITALWGLLTGCERVRYDYSYERVDKYFSMSTLLPSLLCCGALSVGVRSIARRLTATVTSSGQVIYDKSSALPMIFVGAFIACCAVGCVLWFVPYNKVICISNVIPLGVGFFITAIAGGAFFGAPSGFLSVAFVIFLVCSMVVINQGYLIRIINECGTGTANSEVRKFNLAAVLLVFAAVAVVGFFATAALVGIVVTGRIIFFALFRNAFKGNGGGGGGSFGDTPSFNVSEKIFGDIMELEGEGSAMFYYLVFLAMIIAFFVALFIHRKKQGKRLPNPTEIIAKLYSLILGILAWFGSLLSGKRAEDTDISLDDYTDEELIMDKSADRGVPAVDSKRGVRKFVRMLSERVETADRLELCYRVSRAQYIKNHRLLSNGDTPTVLAEKLEHLVAEQEYSRFSRLTAAYVNMAYAGILPGGSVEKDIRDEVDYLTREASDGRAR